MTGVTLRDRLAAAWARFIDWVDFRRSYDAPARAELARLHEASALDRVAEFHARRGDYERAARALAAAPGTDGLRRSILEESMIRLSEAIAPGLTRMRVGQAVELSPSGPVLALHDILAHDLLEVREAVAELRRSPDGTEVVIRYLRCALPDWRLERFLELETARKRPDVRRFGVTMEAGRIRVRCELKGIPLTLNVVLDNVSGNGLRVRFDPPPKAFWIVPIPASEIDRAIQGLAAAAPPGFMTRAGGEGFDLDFGALFAPMRARLNLKRVEVLPGEVRTLAETTEPSEPLALPGPGALIEQAARSDLPAESAALAAEAAAIAPAPSIALAQAARSSPSALSALPGPGEDPLEARFRANPFDARSCRELARRYHNNGNTGASRAAFSILGLLEPGDRESSDYLRTTHGRLPPVPDRPDRSEWLRSPAERREPARRVFTTLARSLGWDAPAASLPAGHGAHPALPALLQEVLRNLGAQPVQVGLADGRPPARVAGPGAVSVSREILVSYGHSESAFFLGRAVGQASLGHAGLVSMPAARQAILAGLVHQLGPASFRGGPVFRPPRTLEAWLSPETIAGLRPDCEQLAPAIERELPLWLAGLELTADRAGLVSCLNARAAVTAMLAMAGGPTSGTSLDRLVASSPDHALADRLHGLLTFAVLDMFRRSG